MTVFEKIQKLLTDAEVVFRVLDHEPVFTSEEAARIRDTDLSQGAKALVMIADKNPLLFVVPGDRRADFSKIKKNFSVKDLRMATTEEVEKLTGLKVGSIPPVGKAIGLKSYFDSSFAIKDEVTFNAGSHTRSVLMQSKDLIKIEDPEILDIT